MIKVSVMYPNTTNSTFDIDYYCNTHFPLVTSLLGDALKGGSVDSGLAGGVPNEEPAFIAMGHLMFNSIEEFQASFGPHAATIMADLANFTNIQPTIQISDIKL
jgi:uncharacterized protein (TIGR02118 family)